MLVHTDNTTVVSYINHQGGLCLCSLFRQVQLIPILEFWREFARTESTSFWWLHSGRPEMYCLYWMASPGIFFLYRCLNDIHFCHSYLFDRPVGPVLEFLQECLSAGLAPATLKVNVAAIYTTNIPLDRAYVGRQPLVSQFLRSDRRLRPICRL